MPYYADKDGNYTGLRLDPGGFEVPGPPRDGTMTWRDGAWQETAESRANLAAPYPVPKPTILRRLHAAGKLGAANAALNGAESEDGILLAERWYAAMQIMSDDADARAFLAAIGAKVDEVLAP